MLSGELQEFQSRIWILIYGDHLLIALTKMQGGGVFQKVGSITPLQTAATS